MTGTATMGRRIERNREAQQGEPHEGPMTASRARIIADTLIRRIYQGRRAARYALFLTPDGVYRIGPEGGRFVLAWRQKYPDSCVGTYNADCIRGDVIDDLLEMSKKHQR